MVSDGCVCGIWRCYAEEVVVSGSVCGHRNKIWQNWTGNGRWMEVMLPGAGCVGLMAGCPGVRAGGLGSGSVDELCVESGKLGQNSGEFVDGNWGKDGGKLDLPATHEICGSNPTKLHHTNKSQKYLWAILVGNFRITDENNKN